MKVGGSSAGGCLLLMAASVSLVCSAMPAEVRAFKAFPYWPSCASLPARSAFFSCWVFSPAPVPLPLLALGGSLVACSASSHNSPYSPRRHLLSLSLTALAWE